MFLKEKDREWSHDKSTKSRNCQ